MIVAETEEDLRRKLTKWKAEMEEKRLRVNLGKTKIMACGINLHTLKDSGKYPCGVCRKGVGSNSIFFQDAHTGYIKSVVVQLEHLWTILNIVAAGVVARHALLMVDQTQNGHSTVILTFLQMLDHFCYLGDTIGAGGGCELSIIARVKAAWGKFREILPILTARVLSLKTCGRIYSTYIRPVLLYASECWAPTVENVNKLQRNDRAMIRWICNVRLKHRVSSASLLEKLCITDIKSNS